MTKRHEKNLFHQDVDERCTFWKKPISEDNPFSEDLLVDEKDRRHQESAMLSHGGVLVVILFSLIAPSLAEEAPKVVAGANSGGCLANYK